MKSCSVMWENFGETRVGPAIETQVLPQPKGEGRHFVELDSLRGIAAVIVMFYHWHWIWVLSPHSTVAERVLHLPPMKFLFEGRASVLLFFLLSGFVLSLPQVRGYSVDYPSYLVKRICRIYLPYLAALALAVVGCWRFHGLQGYGFWFHYTWSHAPTLALTVEHAGFLGDYDVRAYNTAFWSLVQEMRISLVFPLLCWVALRFRAAGNLLLSLLFMLGAMAVGSLGAMPGTYVETVLYTGVFSFGIFMARYHLPMGTWLRSLSPAVSRLLFALTCLLYFYNHGLGVLMHLSGFAPDILTVFAGCLLILFALEHPGISNLLRGRVPLFLGRISYSLYLLHGTVLFVFAYLTFGKLPPSAWLLPYLAITAVLAVFMYEVVEIPSINLGRSLSKRLARIGPSSGP